jgi:hypothetical protein
MATGGVFTLLNNTGFQGKVLLANDHLKQRLLDIEESNRKKDYEAAHEKKLRIAKRLGVDPSTVKISPSPRSWDATLDQIEKTHVLVVNASYKPFVTVGFEYCKVKASGGAALGDSFNFNIPQVGAFFSDMVIHLQLTNLTATSALDKVRYAAFPGHKIIEKITFKVNTTPLDEITRDNYTAYYEHQVMPHKRNAWDRNVGQEIPFVGHVTPNPTTDEFRIYQSIGTGPQTFKRTHDTLDLWIPVLMWFRDPKLAFPQIVVPSGQTLLQVTLASADEIVSFANYGGGGAYTGPTLNRCDLYVNNIFLMPEMHDLFIRNFGFTLIRVHRQQSKRVTSAEKRIHLNDIKWPVECMYVGFRPLANLAISQHWHKNMALTATTVPVPVIVGGGVAINNVVYYDEVPMVEYLELSAHDISVFKRCPAQFYHSYLPSHYGDQVNTSPTPSWHMMNFGFTPGEYQPRGYLNVSKARELYLTYSTENAASIAALSAGADMIVLADCINFLYVRGASAILKFST